MKYKITLKVYPQKGFLPAQESSSWIEESDLNTHALLIKIRDKALQEKEE